MTQENKNEHLERFLINIRKNTARVHQEPAIQELRGTFTGRPAVIIGAGPSLENTAPLLESNQHVVIFTCDRARDRAMAAGVQPTFTVTADPSPVTASFISDPSTISEPLIASTYCAPEILAHPWPAIYFFNSIDNDRAFNTEARSLCPKPEFILGGIIVSNFAFLAASLMGCDPITFIGNDMSATDPEPGWKSTENYIHLPLSDGRMIHTLKSFLLALDWLENYLSVIKKSGPCPAVYNSSEAGIFYSPNIQKISLQQFLAEFA